MPNWVYNTLEVEGNVEDVTKLKGQLSKPYTTNHEEIVFTEDGAQFIQQEQRREGVFSFWNIIKPDDSIIEEYFGPEKRKPAASKEMDDIMANILEDMRVSNHWYAWNVRNWGTKWDVTNDAFITEESDGYIVYRFDTAWAPPEDALLELSSQYPNVKFILSYEEETGWGGITIFENGDSTIVESHSDGFGEELND